MSKPRRMELDAASRDELDYPALGVWHPVDGHPDTREVRYGKHPLRADVVISLRVQRRTGAPGVPWLPASDNDGGGWMFVASASVGGGASVSIGFEASHWTEAMAVALPQLREKARASAMKLEAIGG